MRLVIDGHRLTEQRTGVGRVLEMLLDEWSVTEWPTWSPLLVTQKPVDTRRWRDLDIVSGGSDLPGALWRHLFLAPRVGRDDLLFCPTNLLPRTVARRRVLFVFDTLLESVPETFPLHIRLSYRPRYRDSARRADAILVPSQTTAADVSRHYGVESSRIRVVPLAPDPIFWPGPEGSLAGRKAPGQGSLFLVVGKPSARRNLGAIVSAFSLHSEHHPEDRLLLAGPVQPGELPRGVVFLGHVTEEELLGLYRRASALFYLSEHEGFGLPIVEAQACGCPVVLLRRDSIVETGGDAALYLDQPEIDAIRGAFATLQSTEPRASLSSRGLANAARFSRARMASEVGAILRAEAAL